MMKFKKWNNEISEDLRPCPFCGSEDLDVKHRGNDHTRKREVKVKCKSCRCERTDAALRYSFEWLEEIAIKNWNQRPTSQLEPG